MAKTSELLELDVWRRSWSTSELQAMRRQLAKVANQRMVRLERSRSSVTGEALTFGAYEKATEYLNRQDRNRFSEVLGFKKNTNALKHEINVLQQFLSMKSSTVSGQKEIEARRIETFAKAGVEFQTTKEFYDFLNSNDFKQLVNSGFTSEQIIDIYQEHRKSTSAEESVNALNEALEFFRTGSAQATLKILRALTGLR